MNMISQFHTHTNQIVVKVRTICRMTSISDVEPGKWSLHAIAMSLGSTETSTLYPYIVFFPE